MIFIFAIYNLFIQITEKRMHFRRSFCIVFEISLEQSIFKIIDAIFHYLQKFPSHKIVGRCQSLKNMVHSLPLHDNGVLCACALICVYTRMLFYRSTSKQLKEPKMLLLDS